MARIKFNLGIGAIFNWFVFSWAIYWQKNLCKKTFESAHFQEPKFKSKKGKINIPVSWKKIFTLSLHNNSTFSVFILNVFWEIKNIKSSGRKKNFPVTENQNIQKTKGCPMTAFLT